MSPLEAVLVTLAGVAAGTINTVVGSGTLITFPTLLAFGVPPVTANVSNTVGLVPGSMSGAFGYRRELAGQRGRVLRLGSASLLGGSFGQLVMRVVVVRLDSKPVNLLQALGRTALICLVVPPLVFNRDNRGLHDLAFGTVTLRR